MGTGTWKVIGSQWCRMSIGVALCLAVACDSPMQPKSSIAIVPPAPVAPISNSPFIVSNGVFPPSSTSGAASGQVSASGGMIVYVSLPPASIPGAVKAAISRSNQGVVVVDMIDGGFDPVAVAAETGDTLSVVVSVAGEAARKFVLVVPPGARPKIVRTLPVPFKRDVVLNTRLMVVFSEPIQTAALTANEVQLRQGGSSVSGRLTFGDAAHTTVEFVPDAVLKSGTEYSLTVGANIAGVDGSTLEEGATVSFSTAPGPLVPPVPAFTVLRTTPVANDAAVSAINPNIQIWFNESMDWRTMYPEPFEGAFRIALMLGADTVSGHIGCFNSSASALPACSRIVFDPVAPLIPGRRYEILLKAGLKGMSGATLPNDVRIPFTTQTPPPGEMTARLSVTSFEMVEYQYPSDPNFWYYAPLLRVKETGGQNAARIEKMRFTVPGLPNIPPMCSTGGVLTAPGQAVDLFQESYGDYEVSFLHGDGQRGEAGEATVVIYYSDLFGRIDSLQAHTTVKSGALPTTYTGGYTHGYFSGGACR